MTYDESRTHLSQEVLCRRRSSNAAQVSDGESGRTDQRTASPWPTSKKRSSSCFARRGSDRRRTARATRTTEHERPRFRRSALHQDASGYRQSSRKPAPRLGFGLASLVPRTGHKPVRISSFGANPLPGRRVSCRLFTGSQLTALVDGRVRLTNIERQIASARESRESAHGAAHRDNQPGRLRHAKFRTRGGYPCIVC